jgi:MYXO-CTERM domain-containing protein
MCDDGANTASCNLTNCQPPTCGDGIINAAAGEECDGNELCADDCHWEFSLGGGCAGCSSSGGGDSLLFAGFVAFTLRRRRRARRA